VYRFFVILLILDCIVLITAVLLQAGKGGGLAASFGGGSGGDQLFGARQAGNLLTKTTWWSAGIFLLLAFMLQLMTASSTGPRSVLDQSFTAPRPSSAPAPATGGTANPAVPLQSLPTAPPTGDGKATTPPDPATKKQP